jgi:hypothetical protein
MRLNDRASPTCTLSIDPVAMSAPVRAFVLAA